MSTQIRGKDIGITPGAGTPGSFATKTQSAPEVVLTPNDLIGSPGQQSARALDLAESGRSVGAIAASTRQDPRTTRGIDAWWGGSFVSAEYEANGEGFEKMPDDYTPGMASGRALSGHRRTHRMRYEGAGVVLRMPSATAIRRYSAERGHRTFDVPVSAEVDGRTVQAWVRVTQHGPRVWSTKALGFAPGDVRGLKVAEAANAVLESRRPRVALERVRDLMARRRDRASQVGTVVHPFAYRSSFLQRAGYDRARGVFTVEIGGKAYGYQVSERVAQAVMNARDPGRVYNAMIRGRARRVDTVIEGDRAYAPDRPRRRQGVRPQDRFGVKGTNVKFRGAAVDGA